MKGPMSRQLLQRIAYCLLVLTSLHVSTKALEEPLGNDEVKRDEECVCEQGADCQEIKTQVRSSPSGEYTVLIGEDLKTVYCDMDTAGGGWTVVQRREDGTQNFTRTWIDYADGFGNASGELWLGNRNLAALTSAKHYRLRVDLGDWKNNYRYAEYSLFKVGNESTNFKLTSLGSYTGNAVDSLTYHLGAKFTTYDRNNGANPSRNCAQIYHGGWWYQTHCHLADINGQYNNSRYGEGINWYNWTGHQYSLRFTEMKIRPIAL